MELDPSFRPEWPIRQGDVIGFWDWNCRLPYDRYGLIITADCDIAQGRPDQHLVFLRIISVSDYAEVIWSREKIHKYLDQHLNEITSTVNRLRRLSDSSSIDINSADVVEWIDRENVGQIAASMYPIDTVQQERLGNRLNLLHKLVSASRLPQETFCMKLLLDIEAHQQSSDQRQLRQKLLSKMRGELLNEDISRFFLSSLQGGDDNKGYYILLNQIGAVCKSSITDSFAELKGSSKSTYRFGRLEKTFKYAVAQRFSHLFQRIGLPDAHNVSRRTTLDVLCGEEAGWFSHD
jgi:hypothetical protein